MFDLCIYVVGLRLNINNNENNYPTDSTVSQIKGLLDLSRDDMLKCPLKKASYKFLWLLFYRQLYVQFDCFDYTYDFVMSPLDSIFLGDFSFFSSFLCLSSIFPSAIWGSWQKSIVKKLQPRRCLDRICGLSLQSTSYTHLFFWHYYHSALPFFHQNSSPILHHKLP